MNINPSDLKACYKQIKDGSHSFYAASKLLPKNVRDPAIVLYAFCRIADDTVDLGFGGDDPISSLRERLKLAYLGTPKNLPTDRAFAEMVKSCQMPRELPEALLEGLEWDAAGLSFASLSELHSYSARVASAVGVMMCVLMGVRDKDVLARACDLGAAMQLTNIARDIGEDARNGRLYIPLEWMAEEGIKPSEFLKNPKPGPKIAKLAKRLLSEAENLYNRAEAGLSALPLSCRPGIFAARHIYEQIGRHIASKNYDSISDRAFTTKLEKVGFLALSVANTATVTLMPTSAIVHAAPLKEMEFLISAAAKTQETKPYLIRKTETVLSILEQMERKDRGLQGVLE